MKRTTSVESKVSTPTTKSNKPTENDADVRVIRTKLVATIPNHPDRHQLITEAAYRRAEARGFVAGHELDDWLAAEAEVDARLQGEGRAY